MKLSKLRLPLLLLLFLPLPALAQQDSAAVSPANNKVHSDSLPAAIPASAGDSSKPAIVVKDYDPIGNEEEMDSWENMQYDDSTPFWLELDPDRDYDPPDQREREQEQDGRE